MNQLISTRRCVLIALVLGCSFSLGGFSSAADEAIEITEIKRKDKVDFEKEILPILRRNCLACHNATDAESDLVVETPATLLTGGFDGPAVIAGKGAESLIIKLASRAQESYMPPEDNDVGAKNLTPKELGLIKLWIDQGATGEVVGTRGVVKWQSLPAGVNPIYSVAISADGQYAAAGRANQVFIYHVPSRTEIGRLSDAAIMESGVYDSPGVAFMDIVQSIAFSPDGTMVAAGGYRTLKIWQRHDNQVAATLPALSAIPTSVAKTADGKFLAIGFEDGSLQVLSVADNKIVANTVAHEGGVRGVAFTADDKQIASGGADKTVKVWDAPGLAAIRTITTPAVVNAVAIVAGGTLVASAGEDNIVRIWNMAEPVVEEVKEGQEEVKEGEVADVAELPAKELKGHSGRVTSFAVFSNQPELLASGSADKTVRIWNITTAKQVRAITHGGEVTGIAVNAAGDKIASVSSDKTAKLWNVADGKAIATMSGDYRAKSDVAMIARASTLAASRTALAKKDLDAANARKKSEDDNLTKVKEALTKAEEAFKAKTEAEVKPVADLKTADEALATALETKTTSETAKTTAETAVTDAAAAVKVAQESLAKAQETLKAAGEDEEKKKVAQEAIDKATAELATKTEASKVAVENKKTADAAATKAIAEHKAAEAAQKKAVPIAQKATDEKAAAERTVAASKRSVTRADKAVANAADSIVSYDSSHKLEEAAAKIAKEASDKATTELGKQDLGYTSVSFTADGAQVIVGGLDHFVASFDATNGAAISVYQGKSAAQAVISLGNDIAILNQDKTAVVWSTISEWKLARTINSESGASVFIDRVTAIDFSADGSLLAAGGGEPSRSGELSIFNVADGKLVQSFKDPHSDTIFAARFSVDGLHIATCGADRFVKVFQVSDGEFVRAFEGHTHHVLGVSWSADGRQLASAGADKVIKLWDFRTGDQQRTISGFTKEVTSIQFAGLSTNVVASCGDKNVHIKRADNGGNVRALSGATDYVYNVGVSADGKTIVAGGQDSVVRIWSDDGKSIVTFLAPVVDDAGDAGEE
jgi:WD40 repeat protein